MKETNEDKVDYDSDCSHNNSPVQFCSVVVRSVDTLSGYPYGYTDIRIVVSGDGYPLTDMRISMDICADICDLHVM